MRDTKPVVVLVHGIWMSPLFVSRLGSYLRSRGYRVYYFSYWPTRRPFSRCLADFHSFMQSLPVKHVHLVGHSLGGKLIWQWIHDFRIAPQGRVVTLGSPHRGSVVATKLTRHFWGRLLLGRAQRALIFPQERVPDGWQWGILGGSRPLGLGRLVHRGPVPCDGSVEWPETQLQGASDHLLLPQSHFGLLLSADAAQQVECFLRSGRFCLPT